MMWRFVSGSDDCTSDGCNGKCYMYTGYQGDIYHSVKEKAITRPCQTEVDLMSSRVEDLELPDGTLSELVSTP